MQHFPLITSSAEGGKKTIQVWCVTLSLSSWAVLFVFDLQVATTPSLVTSSAATTLTVNPVLPLASPAVTSLSVTGKGWSLLLPHQPLLFVPFEFLKESFTIGHWYPRTFLSSFLVAALRSFSFCDHWVDFSRNKITGSAETKYTVFHCWLLELLSPPPPLGSVISFFHLNSWCFLVLHILGASWFTHSTEMCACAPSSWTCSWDLVGRGFCCVVSLFCTDLTRTILPGTTETTSNNTATVISTAPPASSAVTSPSPSPSPSASASTSEASSASETSTTQTTSTPLSSPLGTSQVMVTASGLQTAAAAALQGAAQLPANASLAAMAAAAGLNPGLMASSQFAAG